MNKEVKAINKSDNHWSILFANDATMDADFICIASGGYPKSTQFEWLKNWSFY